MSPSRLVVLVLVLAATLSNFVGGEHARAQSNSPERIPTATLIPAPTIAFPSEIDSNSPAVWELIAGQQILLAVTSVAGWPTRHLGSQLPALSGAGPITFANPPPHGVWLEAIVRDEGGTWYGYYHNETPAEVCEDETRSIPRIGAARSHDFGATWEDLGLVLEAPPGSYDCNSTNRYFVGGVGDFSVALDHEQKYLYFFFSQYVDRERTQGVSVARMTWASRDDPVGRMSVWWRDNVWIPARRVRSADGERSYVYSGGMPIYRVVDGWHEDLVVDAFWGPAVHWNTYLEQYVMLLNHARSTAWHQEGIYVAFAKTLTDPEGWSSPRRLIAGGQWYPQVIGLEPGAGTDKVAGEFARFFMGGRSQYFIQFSR
jgi:hypothetical protein